MAYSSHACLQRHSVNRTVWFVPGYLIIRALPHLMAALLPSYRVEHTHTPTHFIHPCKHWLGRPGCLQLRRGALPAVCVSWSQFRCFVQPAQPQFSAALVGSSHASPEICRARFVGLGTKLGPVTLLLRRKVFLWSRMHRFFSVRCFPSLPAPPFPQDNLDTCMFSAGHCCDTPVRCQHPRQKDQTRCVSQQSTDKLRQRTSAGNSVSHSAI